MEGGDGGAHRAHNGAIVCYHMPGEEERGWDKGGEEQRERIGGERGETREDEDNGEV